jgi:hypothetical protein
MNNGANTMTIAQTILTQLGGNRFAAMVGARDFVYGERSLMFRIGFNKSKANKVRITLDANDTYSVEWFKLRSIDCASVETMNNVYADQLRSVFTRFTGLATSL